jgi:hypothetical protein
MHPRTTAKLPVPLASQALADRLRRLSRWVRGLALLAAPLLIAAPVLLLTAPDALLAMGFSEMAGLKLMHLAQGGLTLAVRLRMAAVTLLPVSLGLALLWQLWSLFGEYLRGDVFGGHALACLRRFATLLFVLSLAQPLAQVLMSVAVSWDNPPGQRQLMVMVSSNDYALVLGALVFMAIARVMTEAARVAEENEGFV